jgi:hypothetical protein
VLERLGVCLLFGLRQEDHNIGKDFFMHVKAIFFSRELPRSWRQAVEWFFQPIKDASPGLGTPDLVLCSLLLFLFF